MNLKNLQRYTPEKSDVPGSMYLKAEDGRDWYESQSSFKADTLKLVYNSEGIITSISKDVSMLWPVGQSVVEVEDTAENRKADISGRWKFDGEKVVDTLTAEKARGMKG
ncbi:tail fiber assembly protein, partial [Escherichia coli]|nr:tail fiber assembly protein [Escherichia coli]EEX0409266.1 tail fiber assembly protein [Escherichia coli]EFA0003136.1 tail fiber assembly protein [Escherichia coli]EFA6426894.1 tail fiber assembly protein [Escherichia coli]EFI3299627.1 tail fiber assembly protein [Escherichia coli]